MIQNIINGVVKAIHDTFGAGYEIYTESMEQGFLDPCFSVFCLNPKSERFLGERFYYTIPICVNFFPKGRDKRTKCFEVYEKLANILEVITVGTDSMRGLDIHSEYVDGVLHTFVTYQYYALKTIEKENMETLNQESRVV